MSVYAVIQTGGKQYRVQPGDVLRVERLPAQDGSTIELGVVRMVSQKGRVTVGRPSVPNTRVMALVEHQGKRDKIVVMKYKNKTRYRVKRGHRQIYTQVRVQDIVPGEE